MIRIENAMKSMQLEDSLNKCFILNKVGRKITTSEANVYEKQL